MEANFYQKPKEEKALRRESRMKKKVKKKKNLIGLEKIQQIIWVMKITMKQRNKIGDLHKFQTQTEKAI